MSLVEKHAILDHLRSSRISHEEIAKALGRSRTAATNLLNGKRNLKAEEIPPLTELLVKHSAKAHAPPTTLKTMAYVEIEVLPIFTGEGGNCDGDVEHALIPTRLIRDQLRGSPGDFLLVNILGDSMEPDFWHGDQLLIDRRDRNPTQPGPFALLGEDAYVVKNVERVNSGLRIFSSNPKYSDERLDPEQVSILGRPVWFGRQI